MKEKLPETQNWAARLRDWETTEELPETFTGDWDRLSATLDNKDRPRRRIAWFWWGLPMLTLGLGIWLGKTVFAEGGSIQLINAFPLFEVTNLTLAGNNVKSINKLVEADVKKGSSSIERVPKTLLLNQEVASPYESGSKDAKSRKVTAFKGENDPSGIEGKEAGPQLLKSRPIGSSNGEKQSNVFATPLREELSINKLVPRNESFVVKPLPPKKLAPLAYNVDYTMEAKMVEPPSKAITPVKPRTWNFLIGPQVGLEKSILNLELPEGTLRSQSFTNSLVKSGGVMARLERGKFGVETGLLYSHESSRYRYLILRTYDQRDESPDPAGGGTTTFDLEIAGNQSKVQSEIEVLRPEANQFVRPQRILINADLTETTRTTSIPLQLSYDVSLSNKFAIRSATGIAWNQQSVATDLTARLVQRGDFMLGRTRIITRENLLKQTYWTGQLISGLVYQPGNRWQFDVSFRYGYAIGKLTNTENAMSNLSRFSLQVGGKFQLF